MSHQFSYSSQGGHGQQGGQNYSYSSQGGHGGSAGFSSQGGYGGHGASAGFSSQGFSAQGGHGGGASYQSSQSASFSQGGGSGVAFSGNAADVARVLPASLANAQGYGQYEVVQSLSAQSQQAVDPKILQHENPACCKDLAPGLSPDQYKLNVDQNPIVIRKKAQDKVTYQQEVEVKYLKPPQGQRGGDIVIRQQLGKQVAPAPPLIVRQQPQQPQTPQPIVLREAPPQAPAPLQGKEINLPAKNVPPPARKVIVERLAPVPAKPQKVYLERWLGFGNQTQRVVFHKAGNVCVIPDPKNVVIQWDAPDVDIKHEFRNHGVHPADPQQYLSQYGSQLASAQQINEVAQRFNIRFEGVELAAQSRSQVILEGDVDALSLIDLDQYGLGHLRNAVRGGGGAGASAGGYSSQGGVSGAIGGAAGGYSSQSAGGYSAQGGAGAGNAGFAYSSQGAAGQGGYSAQGGAGAGHSYNAGYSSQGGVSGAVGGAAGGYSAGASYGGAQGASYDDCAPPPPQPGC